MPTTTQLASGRARTLIQDLDTGLKLSSMQSTTFHRILPSTTVLLDQGPTKHSGARKQLWDGDTLIFKVKNRVTFLGMGSETLPQRSNGKRGKEGQGKGTGLGFGRPG